MENIQLKSQTGLNPLDDLEEIAQSQDLPNLRISENELVIRYPDSWENLQSLWAWDPEFECLEVVASTLMSVDKKATPALHELLSKINDHLWIGHFDTTDEGSPTFRHTSLLRGMEGSYIGVMEDLFAVVLSEFQRFYPAFDYVVRGKKTPDEALKMAMVETQGEA